MAEEKNIENKIRKDWLASGGYVVKNHGSMYTRKGVPDLTGAYGGGYVAIEVKQPKGIPSPAQLRELKAIAETGSVACIAFDKGAWTIIKNYADGVDTDYVGYFLPDVENISVEYTKDWWKVADKSQGVVFIYG